jgi:hypothetical protein
LPFTILALAKIHLLLEKTFGKSILLILANFLNIRIIVLDKGIKKRQPAC